MTTGWSTSSHCLYTVTWCTGLCCLTMMNWNSSFRLLLIHWRKKMRVPLWFQEINEQLWTVSTGTCEMTVLGQITQLKLAKMNCCVYLGAERFAAFALFAAQDYYPSFFMPKCHQSVWLMERYLKQFHVRLYQRAIQTYTDLFRLNEQQSRGHWLKYIKSMFIPDVLVWVV